MTPDAPGTRSLCVAAVEIPHRWNRVETQWQAVDAALAGLVGVDVALLGELALTGYVDTHGRSDPTHHAESLDGPTVTALGARARQHGIALAGPLVERVGTRVFNTLVLVDATGTVVGHWRKRHPWYPEHWATPGDVGTPVVTVKGMQVTAAVCFDIHFVQEDAPESLARADVLLYPSAWVDQGTHEDARGELLPAVARTAGLWVVNANWGRGRPAVHGQGGSMVVDPAGAVVQRLPPGSTQGVVTARVGTRVHATTG